MEIIREREHVTEVEYYLAFNHKPGQYGAGFAFPCDEHGDTSKGHRPLAPEAVENLDFALNYGYDKRVERREHSYTLPRVGRCDCGAEVHLDSFTNTCDRCGRDYNMSGDLLAPRSQWGEETGEHWTECY